MNFFDSVSNKNNTFFTFIENSFYLDGISSTFGYKHFKVSLETERSLFLQPLPQISSWKGIALTVMKLVCFAQFPVFAAVLLSVRIVCRLHYTFSISASPKIESVSDEVFEKIPSQVDIRGREWMNNIKLVEYFGYLGSKHKELYVPYPSIYTNSCIHEAVFEPSHCLKEQVISLEKQFLAYPLHVTNNHWTLVIIDQEKRTVEYYDSKKNYGNYEEIVKTLNGLARSLSAKDPGQSPYQFFSKISKNLQPDSYQCGPWTLYFLKNRLENPSIDFNKLDIAESQDMIAKFRLEVMTTLYSRLKEGKLRWIN